MTHVPKAKRRATGFHDDTLIQFIREFTASHGFAPTYVEMADGLGYSTTSSIHRRVHRLAAQHRLSVDPNSARGIRVIEDGRLSRRLSFGREIAACADAEAVDGALPIPRVAELIISAAVNSPD